MFDAITAFGSFEHVASVKDYLNGKRGEIYEDFFRHVANLLHSGGKFYMQSMVFDRIMIPFDQIDINSPRGSDS